MPDISSIFYRNGRLIALVVLLLIGSGLLSLSSLPRKEDPALSERFATLEVEFPGASSERVESLVARPIEDALLEIEEIAEVESFSRANRAFMVMQLKDEISGKETGVVWAEVRDSLADVAPRLPEQASAPELQVRTVEIDGVVIALFVPGMAEGQVAPSSDQLRPVVRLAERLADELRRVEGTRLVALFGAPEEEVLVELDAPVAAAVGLDAAAVARRIGAMDSRTPAGTLRGERENISLEILDTQASLESIRALPVAPGLRLDSVAQVRRTFLEPRDRYALIGGQPAVIVAAQSLPQLRIDLWTERVLDSFARFRQQLPPGMQARTVFAQNDYVGSRLGGLVRNFGAAVVVVFLVLLFFLGRRGAVLVGLGLPLTVLGVLALMPLFGVYFQQMSVTGLIIALGLLIDNPIVVVDYFQRMRALGLACAEAVRRTARRLWVPLGASTLTTAFAFLPIAAAPGPVGEFVGTMATMVVISVCVSLLVSLTLILALAGKAGERAPGAGGIGTQVPALRAAFERLIDLILRRPLVGLAMGLALPVLGLLMVPTMESNFFPPVDRDMFAIELHMPQGSTAQETMREVGRAREVLGSFEEVVEDAWFVGDSLPRVFYNLLSNEAGRASVARAFVRTRSPDATRRLLLPLQERLRRELAGSRVLALPFGQGPPVAAPLEVRVVGPSLEVLRRLGDQLRLRMAGLPEVTYAISSLDEASLRLQLEVESARLSMGGGGANELGRSLGASLRGVIAGQMTEGDLLLPIRVRSSTVLGASDDALSQPLASGLRPASWLAAGYGTPSGIIPHWKGERYNLVQAWNLPYALPSNSESLLRASLEEDPLVAPPGHRLEFGGEGEASAEGVAKLGQTAAFFLTLMVISVVLAMQSFKRAAVVGSVALLSVGLAMLGVKLSGEPRGFIAIVGSLGLVGLAINGALIVSSGLMDSERAMQGDKVAQREVVVESSRHILATTATTIGGFMPLILVGETFWKPLAWAMVGGVAGSAILALVWVPATFAWSRR